MHAGMQFANSSGWVPQNQDGPAPSCRQSTYPTPVQTCIQTGAAHARSPTCCNRSTSRMHAVPPYMHHPSTGTSWCLQPFTSPTFLPLTWPSLDLCALRLALCCCWCCLLALKLLQCQRLQGSRVLRSQRHRCRLLQLVHCGLQDHR